MFAYVSSPYIVTVWVSGPLAAAYIAGPGWRWFYGSFAIITFVVVSPLQALFWVNYRKAVRAGIIVPARNNRSFMECVRYYAVEFDVGGLFLLMGGLVFFLLPFNLYSYQDGQWRSAFVISFLIIGGLMLIGFALYEKFIAPKSFIPFELLLDRTILSACVVSGVFFISFFIWNAYFYSYLAVVTGLNVTEATYIINIYSIGACFFSLVVGLLIRWTGRFKWIALYFGVPVSMLGVGLMIYFRNDPHVSIGFIVMSQILIAFAGGAVVITEQMAAMAATTHQYVAVVLAVEGMFSNIGGGIGSSISAALWTGVFPKKLAKYLPAEAQGDLTKIYSDIVVQLSYPKGTPTRTAIEHAYADSQRYMATMATAVLVIALGAVMMWKGESEHSTLGRVLFTDIMQISESWSSSKSRVASCRYPTLAFLSRPCWHHNGRDIEDNGHALLRKRCNKYWVVLAFQVTDSIQISHGCDTTCRSMPEDVMNYGPQ